MLTIRTFLAAVATLTVATALSDEQKITPPNCLRNTSFPTLLPASIVPNHYHLELDFPNPNSALLSPSPLIFEGIISINVSVRTDTSCIILHSGKFNYSRITLDGNPASYTIEDESGMLIISPAMSLKTGDNHQVVLSYVGYVNDDTNPATDGAHGVFLSPNTVPPPTFQSDKATSMLSDAMDKWRLRQKKKRQRKSNGQYRKKLRESRLKGEEMLIATQFEESDARNMFPSFDEPGYKTTFTANITVPDCIKQVFFNTPLVSTVANKIRKKTTFIFMKTKHPLPTYLIALAIGRFDILERISRGVQYRIITPPGYKSWAGLAMNASIHANEFFSDMYSLNYSDMNDKMDSISVGGIDMDAMENQGLLTYAPQMLLLNPNASQLPASPCGEWGRFAQAQLIVLVTTHEIHHMWFGDTVTMRDWSQEYLNEGFTRFMQSVGTDNLVDWDMTGLTGKSKGRMNSFFQFSYEVAMTFDTPGTAPSIVYPIRGGGDIPPFPPSNSTKTVVSDVTTTDTAELLDPTKAPLFSRIFYEKGASVNRMVYTLLGENMWYDALSKELHRHLWQNPTVEDMMRSLDGSFLKMGLPSAIDSFLPWLRRPGYPIVTLSVDGTTLKATQKPMSKYLKNQNPWWVPLQIATNNDPLPMLLSFNTTEATIEYKQSPANVVGDPSFWGFFIVKYETDAMWMNRITLAVKNHASTPDYSRELIFHLTLMVTMSHEKASRLTQALTEFSHVLASNTKLGGWEGEGSLYSMIMARTTPIVSLLAVCGKQCDDEYQELTTILRQMTGSLTKRLAIPYRRSLLVSNVSTPWPSSEDPGVEMRDRAVLRPVSTLAAVVYNDTSAVLMSLAMFRNASSNLNSQMSRAMCFAAGKYGTEDDYAKLLKLKNSSVDSEKLSNIIFGLTASAGKNECTKALSLIAGSSQQFSAFGDMLVYSHECRNEVENAIIKFAQESWNKDGESTMEIVKVLNLFATTTGLASADVLLKRNIKYVSSTDANAILVNIHINLDMIAANSKPEA
jgi:aminopeptidase N